MRSQKLVCKFGAIVSIHEKKRSQASDIALTYNPDENSMSYSSGDKPQVILSRIVLSRVAYGMVGGETSWFVRSSHVGDAKDVKCGVHGAYVMAALQHLHRLDGYLQKRREVSECLLYRNKMQSRLS